MSLLSGKVAVVTGGSSGIGFAIARRFLVDGASVVITGRDLSKLEAAARELGSDRCRYMAGDAADPTACQQVVALAISSWRRLDILVNNAGVVRRDKKLCEVDPEEWDAHLAINLKSYFLNAKAAIPEMVRGGGGAIVNISSQLAVVAAPKYPAYCAAKAGVIGLTRSIAVDYGEQRIRCNAVCPGLVETPLAYVQRENFDAVKADIAKLHPLGRIGRPDDIAAAVAFLASDDADWITGQALVVDGGYTAK